MKSILFSSFLLLLAGIACREFSYAENAGEGLYPENPMVGARVFFEKGCTNCHRLMGEDKAKFGPDLSAISSENGFYDIASRMWNHSPIMDRAFKKKSIEHPEFSGEEFMSLIAFLTGYRYYLTSFGHSGDALKGEKVFEAKSCNKCHAFADDWSKFGPRLDKFVTQPPIRIAQGMWNHVKYMKEGFRRLRVEFPKFRGDEMSDLLAYLKAKSGKTTQASPYDEPGSPKRGSRVFAMRGCANCHAVGKKKSKCIEKQLGDLCGPNLGSEKKKFLRNFEEIAGIMWNHAGKMERFAERTGTAFPHLKGGDLRDVIAYLYFTAYMAKAESHNTARGRKLYSKKFCSRCHDPQKDGAQIALGLDFYEADDLPATFTADMWNHIPDMRAALVKIGTKWPHLDADELRDIANYIASRGEQGN